MDLREFINSFNLGNFNLQLSEAAQRALTLLAIRLGSLAICIGVAIIIGRLIPWVTRFILQRISTSEKRKGEYTAIVTSVERPLSMAAALIFISISLNLIRNYRGLYSITSFFVDAAVTITLAWAISQMFKQLIRLYGVSVLGRVSDEVNDMVLIFETVVNFLIGFFAITIFAQSRNFNFLA
ncbi:MAG: mechanosensitive ion channel family protein, partial [Cyanobacteria bacterium P01_A01_bin.15]